MVAHGVSADRADQTYVVPGQAEPAGHVGRTPADAPPQRLGIDVVAGGRDALNTQDDVRRGDAEHNDLSHVHNLTQRDFAVAAGDRGGGVRPAAATDRALILPGTWKLLREASTAGLADGYPHQARRRQRPRPRIDHNPRTDRHSHIDQHSHTDRRPYSDAKPEPEPDVQPGARLDGGQPLTDGGNP